MLQHKKPPLKIKKTDTMENMYIRTKCGHLHYIENI